MTGIEFREIREKLQLNQTNLARLMGTVQPTISRWERTQRIPSIPAHFAHVIDVAVQYGVPMEKLALGKE